MRLDNGRIHYVELFVAMALMVLFANGSTFLFFISEQISLLGLFLFSLIIAHILAYVLVYERNPSARCSAFLHITFALAVIAFVAAIASDGGLAAAQLVSIARFCYYSVVYFVVFLPIFFLTMVAAYFIRVKRDYRTAAMLLLVALLLLVLFYASNFFLKSYGADDEEFLTLESVKMLLNGTNPYATSVAGALYGNVTQIGASVTTLNTVMGTMDYPALFFLTFVPFYFLSEPNLISLMTVAMPRQAVAFLFILLLSFALLVRKEDLLRPKLALLALLVLAVVYVASITTFLMLALVIISYAKIGSKYAWLPLGLCLAIQEQLWLPVLFLVAYSLGRHGIKQGMRNAAGAGAVFLLINAYFIALGPGAYFEAVFSPLSKLLMPIQPSPFGFLLMESYPILLSAYSQLFMLAAILFALIIAYTRQKRLVPVFSLLTLLIIPHVLISYYAFFLFFTMFAACTDDSDKGRGALTKFFVKNKPLVYGAAAAIVVAMAAIVIASHSAYARDFGVTLHNNGLVVDPAHNVTVYTGSIRYGGSGNRTVYLLGVVKEGIKLGMVGLYNNSIINSTPMCGTYDCKINTNWMVLRGGGAAQNITLRLTWPNESRRIDYASIVVYDGEYFYVGDGIKASNG
ncbi:Uncharacterised protein [uncultured archaeon]|nr:Uncharacterised protein [uncultured archaeon]